MEIKEHLLVSARQLPSPNVGARPEGEDISLLVIHNISLPPGEFGGRYIDDLFCNCLDYAAHPFFKDLKDLRVSSHLLIDRKGRITQYVPFNLKAHHAGVSCFEGREQCNDFSIGIELEGCDDQRDEKCQYEIAATVVKLLMQRFPGIGRQDVVGHCDIAPGRKTDPGEAFDWTGFRALLDQA